MEIPDYLDLLNLDDSKVYRVFVNANFCRVMDEKTDHRISFFGHASLDKSKHAIDPDKLHIQKICPLCGASMKLREGRFGEFLGCSHYPNCIYTAKIPVIRVKLRFIDTPIEKYGMFRQALRGFCMQTEQSLHMYLKCGHLCGITIAKKQIYAE